MVHQHQEHCHSPAHRKATQVSSHTESPVKFPREEFPCRVEDAKWYIWVLRWWWWGWEWDINDKMSSDSELHAWQLVLSTSADRSPNSISCQHLTSETTCKPHVRVIICVLSLVSIWLKWSSGIA